uniref:hypothetical protein n=1 Tax=Faecalibacterium sp. TaxID=1971605 RepID=UPI0040294A39
FTPHSSTLLYIQTPPVCFEVHREYGRRGKPLCVEKITRPPGSRMSVQKKPQLQLAHNYGML